MFEGVFDNQGQENKPQTGNQFEGVFGTPSVTPPKASLYGASTQKDISGKPFATVPVTIPKTFMHPEFTVSETDKSRIATDFDPTVPQKLTPGMFQENRMPESVSSQIRGELGAGYNDELDHRIAISLSGSNDPENLKVISKMNNQKYGQLEAQLARDVSDGKISLRDAHIAEAKAKGVKLAEDKYRNNAVNQWLLEHGNILKPLAKAQQIITGIGKGIKNVVTHPVETIGGIGTGAIEAAMGLEKTAVQGLKTAAETVAETPIIRKTAAGLVSPALASKPVQDVIKTGSEKMAKELDKASQYVGKNKEAINQIFNVNLKVRNAEQAGHVGEFVGQQLPYLAASELTAAKAIPIATKLLGGAGKLTMSQASNIGRLTTAASNVAMTAGINQLIIDSDTTKDERLKQLVTDVMFIGVLEGVGVLASSIKNASTANKIRQFNADLKSGTLVDQAEIANRADNITQSIVNDTGKTPQQLFRDEYPKLPPGKETSLLGPKMGDIMGEGFVATEKVDKANLAKQRAINTYNQELEKYTKNPTPAQREKVLKAKQTRDAILEAKPMIPPKPEVIPTTAETPSKVIYRGGLKPVEGTGEVKTRGVAKGLEANAIEKGLVDNLGDLPEYRTVNMKEQSYKAIELMNNDPDLLMDVAMGRKPAPKGLIPESAFVAVEKKAIAEGDTKTIMELAKSNLVTEATTMGQRIRTLGERDPNSPIAAIKEIQKARETAATARIGEANLEKAKTKVVKEIRYKISVSKPKIDWNSFVEEITCR